MQQELELVPKEADYVNPYKGTRQVMVEPKPQEIKKKKEKKQRGPGLSGGRKEL